MINKNILVVFLIFIFLINFLFVQAQEAEKNYDYYLNNFEDFVKWNDEQAKKDFYSNLSSPQKKEIQNKLKEYFKLNIELGENLLHKNVMLKNNKLIALNKNGDEVGFDFENYDDKNFPKVDYDYKNKQFVYTNKKGGIIRIDKGRIDKDGKHQLSMNLLGGERDPEISFKYIGKGEVSYENGEYRWLNLNGVSKEDYSKFYLKVKWWGSEGLVDRYYSPFKPGEGETSGVRITNKGELIKIDSINTKVMIINPKPNKNGEKYAAAVIETSPDHWIAGYTIGRGIRDKKDPYMKTKGAYWVADLSNKEIIIRGNEKSDLTGQNNYINARIYEDFNKVEAQGAQTWLTLSNKEKLNFAKGQINRNGYPLTSNNKLSTSKNSFEVLEILNAENPDRVFAWQTDNNGNSVLYDTNKRYVVEAQLWGILEDTKGRVLNKDLAASFLVETSERYSKEFFRGTEEQRFAAIALDPDSDYHIHNVGFGVSGNTMAGEFLDNLDMNFQQIESSNEEGYLNRNADDADFLWPVENQEYLSELPNWGADLRSVAGAALYRAYRDGEIKNLVDTYLSFQGGITDIYFKDKKVIVSGRKNPPQEVSIGLLRKRTINDPVVSEEVKMSNDAADALRVSLILRDLYDPVKTEFQTAPNKIKPILQGIKLKRLDKKGYVREVENRVGIGSKYTKEYFKNYNYQKYVPK